MHKVTVYLHNCDIEDARILARDLVSTTYAMAAEANESLLYLPNGKTSTVRLDIYAKSAMPVETKLYNNRDINIAFMVKSVIT